MSKQPIQHDFPKGTQHMSEDSWRSWVIYHHWKRTSISNERKFIAWLRTGLTLATLGFIVERIEIFLSQAGEPVETVPGSLPPIAYWIPPAFFVLAAMVTVFGTLDFFGDRRRIRDGDMARSNLLDSLVFATLIVLVLSTLVFLFSRG
jgi:uncharacterized membrane protein YidH (DUF202 family)